MGRGGGSRFVGSKVEEAECEYDQTMCQEFLKILIRYIKTKKQLSYSRKNDMKMCSWYTPGIKDSIQKYP